MPSRARSTFRSASLVLVLLCFAFAAILHQSDAGSGLSGLSLGGLLVLAMTGLSLALVHQLSSERAGLLRRVGQLTRALEHQRRHAEKLASLTITDELTGLNNRRGFLFLADQHLKLALRSQTSFAVMFLDLNGLKTINDTLGHEAGDRAIRSAARLLRQTLRDCDILGRLGGDEFVALVNAPSASAVRAIERRIAQALSDENDANTAFELSFSIGDAMFDPKNPKTLSALLAEADERMYEGKLRHRSGVPALQIVRSA